MTFLFWLSFLIAIAGTFVALYGGLIMPCRIVVLAALGTAMGALVIMGSIEALIGLPLLGGAALVVALTDIDASF